MPTRRLHLVSDLFDPRRGSEFQVPQLALRALAALPDMPITLWTTRRADNEAAIRAWLEQQGLTQRVVLCLSPLRRGDAEGHHATPLHLALDLIDLYRAVAKGQQPGDRVWKCGQINLVFNLLALPWLRCDVMGPVSGLEPPAVATAAAVPLRYRMRLLAYAALLSAARCGLWLAHRCGRVGAVLVATRADQALLPQALRAASVHHPEADMEALLQRAGTAQEAEDTQPRAQQDLGGQPLLLWSGALIERKNPLLAFEVLSHVLRAMPAARACMIGDGPLAAAVQTRMKALDPSLRERLSLLPTLPRAEFLLLLARARALLVTSLREANSLLVLEALAADVAVVASAVSGLRDTVPATGRLFDVHAKDAAERAAESLLAVVAAPPTVSPRAWLMQASKAQGEALYSLLRERLT